MTTSTWRTRDVLAKISAVLLVTIACFSGVQLSQQSNQMFDVFDEGAHFDYAEKLIQGHIPKWGSLYEQDTMLIADCLGNSLTKSVTNCASIQRSPQNYPPSGFSYEAQQPPLGYAPYALALKISKPTDPKNLLDNTRDTGAVIILTVAGIALLGLAFLLRLGFTGTLLLSGLILLSPNSVHALSTVNNDAATLVVSIIFVASLVLSESLKGKRAIALGIAIGIVLGLTKAFLILLPLSVAFVIVAGEFWKHRQDLKQIRAIWKNPDVKFSLTAALCSGLVAVGFTTWQQLRSPLPSQEVLNALLGFEPRVSFVQPSTILSSFSNLANEWLGISNGLINSPDFFNVTNVIFLLLMGGAFIRSKLQANGSGHFRLSPGQLATTWGIIVVAFGVGWPVLLFIQGHFNFDAPSRYGLLALPVAATAISMRLKRVKDIE